LREKNNNARKAAKAQRPPEVLPSGYNFFAPWRLCEKIEKNRTSRNSAVPAPKDFGGILTERRKIFQPKKNGKKRA
jgi:hypothetical protein